VDGKRLLDVTLAALLAIVLAPLLILCAGTVLFADGSPILFTQERVGRFGRGFPMFKFRTMRPVEGPLLTSAGDARVTPLGAWMRRLKLDELPQLWNVLRGDMSLVGPRPEVPAYVARAPRGFRAIASLRPGMTDWASLAFRDEELILRTHAADPTFYLDTLLPRKLALARLYLRKRSLGLDGALIAATAALVLGLNGLARRLAGARLLLRARAGIAD